MPQLLLRSPFFSFEAYVPENIRYICRDFYFLQALNLASPAFYKTISAKNFDHNLMNSRELLSLTRYYNRMCFRPTPFGGFSSFTLTQWGHNDQLILSDDEQVKIHTQPDQGLVMSLAAAFSNKQQGGIFFVNPTLYQLGNEYRFIKSIPPEKGTKLLFVLESLSVSTFTKKLIRFIRQGQKSEASLIKFIARQTLSTPEEAFYYLGSLKEAQVIQSTLNGNITGPDYFNRMINEAQLPDPEQKVALHQLQHIFAQSPFLHSVPVSDIESTLARLNKNTGGEFAGRNIYSNTERAAISGAIDKIHQQTIQEAVNCLSVLIPKTAEQALGQFRKEFYKRYENQKVPLLQALDPDSGVGYANLAEHVSTSHLLEQVSFPKKNNSSSKLEWSAIHQLLLKKWHAVIAAGGHQTIVIQKADLANLQTELLNFPPSLPVIFRMIDGQIFIESVGGISGTSLIGRFTPFNKGIHQLGLEIAQEEATANPDVIFAEIAQLSDHHTDNVNRRASVYTYEIPINSISVQQPDKQIQLDDLLVSIVNNEVILESKVLNKVVVPRLSSAYNYHHNQLSVFRFLCDMQYQGVQSNLTLNLEQYFPGMPFYPRVQFEDIILCAAKWQLNEKEIRDVCAAGAAGATAMRNRLMLPAVIALTHFDQQLVFNLDKPTELQFFADCLKGMEDVVLQEYFIPRKENHTVINPNGKPYINQFIAFLINNNSVYHNQPLAAISNDKVQRVFTVGSRWLYFKIYCTPVTANVLLTQKIMPLLKQIEKQGETPWFFIRYADTGAHLRLRINVNEQRVGEVIALFKTRFAGLINDNMVREYSADTYRRELERYGADMIETIEQFFWASSGLCICFIKSAEVMVQPYVPHRLALISVTGIIDLLFTDINDQVNFLQSVCQSFYNEFNGDKAMKVELDNKYRGMKDEIKLLLTSPLFYKELKLNKQHAHFKRALNIIKAQSATFTIMRKFSLVADMIHMHLNRLFIDQQRKQELVIYHCLYKFKRSEKALLTKTINPKMVV